MPRPSAHPVAEKVCLAIEASNPSVNAEVGVGVWSGQGQEPRMLAIEPLREVGRNEDDLLPAIDRACAAAGIQPRQIRAVAVSIGPGGYTSLRVATAAGKTIAEAVGATCIAIPTALSLVHAFRDRTQGARMGVLLAGKDQSAFLTLFPRGGWSAGENLPIGRLVTAADFPLDEVDAVIGDRHVPAPIVELLATRGIQFIPPCYSATACLEIAPFLREIDPVELVPLYPREPDAVTLWRQRRHR